jgi:hypothetical protein
MRKIFPALIFLIFLIQFAFFNLVTATEFFSNGDFESGKTVWFFSGTSDVDQNTVWEGSFSGILPAANDWIRQPTAGVWNDGAGGITNHTHFSAYIIHNGAGLHEIDVIVDYHDESSATYSYNITNSWVRYNIFPDLDPVKGVYNFRFVSPAGATVDFFIDWVTFGDGVEPTPTPIPIPSAGEIVSDQFIAAATATATMFVIVNMILIIQLMSDRITAEQFTKAEVGILLLSIVLVIMAGVVTNY